MVEIPGLLTPGAFLAYLGANGRGAPVTEKSRVAGESKAKLLAEELAYQIGCVFCAVFFQQIGSMKFDGARADTQLPCDFLTCVTPNDASQHRPFAPCQKIRAWGTIIWTYQVNLLTRVPQSFGPSWRKSYENRDM